VEAINPISNFLITGANGQLGRALQQTLNAQEITHSALSHQDLDITDELRVEEMLDALKPTHLINTAAWTNVDAAESNQLQAIALNGTAIKGIAALCEKRNVKLIHISTDYVFSGLASKPWAREAQPCPTSVYGTSKALGEKAVSEGAPNNGFIVRTAWLYSPWGKNFAKTILRKALYESDYLEVVDDQIGQPTSALDVAVKLVELSQSEFAPGIYHATNSGQASWFDFAKYIFLVSESDSARVRSIKSTDLIQPAPRPSFSVLDDSCWSDSDSPPLQEWRDAFVSALPSIVEELKLEMETLENH